MNMIGREQIAAMLGITRERVRKSLETREDFPRPVLRLSRKTVRWHESDVRQWLERERQRA
jgi:predicted DNA-binding transcriptional regulator AlpA